MEKLKSLIDSPLELCCDLYSIGFISTSRVEEIVQVTNAETKKGLISRSILSFSRSHGRFINDVLKILEQNDYLSEFVYEIQAGTIMQCYKLQPYKLSLILLQKQKKD